MRKLIIALLGFVATTTLASAADLNRQAFKAPEMYPVFNWTGFYVGANGGYLTESGDGINGGFGGAQIGYNYEFPSRWVVGVELDSAGAGASDSVSETFNGVSATAEAKINYFGTLRGRVGFAGWDRILAYGTGGFAWAHVKASVAGTVGTVGGTPFAFSDDKTLTGWTIGGGIEGALNNNWTVKAEYLYADLGNEDFFSSNASLKTHIIKAGFNYLFH